MKNRRVLAIALGLGFSLTACLNQSNMDNNYNVNTPIKAKLTPAEGDEQVKLKNQQKKLEHSSTNPQNWYNPMYTHPSTR